MKTLTAYFSSVAKIVNAALAGLGIAQENKLIVLYQRPNERTNLVLFFSRFAAIIVRVVSCYFYILWVLIGRTETERFMRGIHLFNYYY